MVKSSMDKGHDLASAMFQFQVTKYAKVWCGLAHMSIVASTAVSRTDQSMDYVMTHLPGEKDVPAIIQNIDVVLAKIKIVEVKVELLD